ncbi:MAG: DUF3098 domain-containing protein [Bacteroidota bacterium]
MAAPKKVTPVVKPVSKVTPVTKVTPGAAKITKEKETKKSILAFDRDNYKWMLIGIALLALGYVLMIGGGSTDPNVFSEDLFSFRRLTLSPIIILAGFVVEIYAIMKKPAAAKSE